ncbi:Putative chloroperoxidase [Septoria linicola]|uniref:Chloroperoxidase n=1 Tax=Septoria linicola TaxID=215465 RepID=A0A9Q9B7P8_9PEZI|nr:Putative chloroperoxidase [Septoria linicola]
MSQFKELLGRQPDPATANYDVNVIVEHRAARYQQSVSKNPWFYYGPFTSFVGAAAHVLIPAMFSNHSEEFPAGKLDQETLKSFFAITGDNDNLVYTPGHERIPADWYKRPDKSERYPETIAIGCNMGEVNTFTLINTTDTKLDSYDFASPTGAVCYAYALAGSLISNVPLVSLLFPLIGMPIQNALGGPTTTECSR